MELLKALNAALGLEETGSEQAALAAIAALKSGTSLNAAALARIAAAARLAADADVETVVNAVTGLADPAKTVPAAAFEEVKTALNTAVTRLTTLEAQGKREKAETYVDGEIKKGRVGVKPSRDHFIALHMANAGDCEKVISGFPVMQGSVITALPAGADQATALNSVEARVAELMGIDPEAMKKTKAALAAQQESR